MFSNHWNHAALSVDANLLVAGAYASRWIAVLEVVPFVQYLFGPVIDTLVAASI